MFLGRVLVDGGQGGLLSIVEYLHLIAADDEIVSQFHLSSVFLFIVLQGTA